MQRIAVSIILLGALAVGCASEDMGDGRIVLKYSSPEGTALSVEMLELRITETLLFRKTITRLHGSDFSFDGPSDTYSAAVDAPDCCNAQIEFWFVSDPSDVVVSGSISVELDPNVQWTIESYPYRPPFFQMCYDNRVYPVAEEYRDTYGDSLYVMWDRQDLQPTGYPPR